MSYTVSNEVTRDNIPQKQYVQKPAHILQEHLQHFPHEFSRTTTNRTQAAKMWTTHSTLIKAVRLTCTHIE